VKLYFSNQFGLPMSSTISFLFEATISCRDGSGQIYW
jgi:hypothetical protein